MCEEIPADAFLSTPTNETTETIYNKVLEDGAILGVRVHPNRSLCRISYETPIEHSYPDVVEELTLLIADGVPEFIKQSVRPVGRQTVCHEDILYLHVFLPQVIAAMKSPDESYLRAALETYVRNTTN